MTGKSNRKATAVCHPIETRPISARECAALQGFPADWQFAGATGQQYMQAGNAVPISLGRAIGAAILAHESQSKARKIVEQTHAEVEAMVEASIRRLRAAGANNKSASKKAA